MHAPSPHRQSEIRNLIQGFIVERLATKLEGLANDDLKRATLPTQYAPGRSRPSPIRSRPFTRTPRAPTSTVYRAHCPSISWSAVIVWARTLPAMWWATPAALDDYQLLKLE